MKLVRPVSTVWMAFWMSCSVSVSMLLALGGYYYSLYTHQYRAEATRNAFEA